MAEGPMVYSEGYSGGRYIVTLIDRHGNYENRYFANSLSATDWQLRERIESYNEVVYDWHTKRGVRR